MHRSCRSMHARTRAALRALAVAAMLGAASLGASACGADEPVAKPAVSVAKTPVKVADTTRGAVAYRSVGSGSPLVMVMGFGSSMEDWDPTFVDALAKTHRVVILDNAGIGKSDRVPSGKLTISGMADQTAALVDALGLDKPDVLGWSMGGMVAQALTARHPDDVRRLVLSATWPGNGQAREDRSKAPPADATAAQFIAALFPENQKAAVKSYSDGLDRYTDRATVPDPVYGEQRAAINGWLAGKEPAGKRFAMTSVQTLVAGGAEDRFNPIYNTRLLAKLVKNSELKVYANAGHAFLFQPDTGYARRVESFLSR
jgi:pimeloyl-ACP methyl ester carboxylesterase